MRRLRRKKNLLSIFPKKLKSGKHHEPVCMLSLCDPHFIKELACVWEQEDQAWAKQMKKLLEDLNTLISDGDGILNCVRGKKMRSLYRKLVKQGRIESLSPAQFLNSSNGAENKKSRAQDLLDRLSEYEEELFNFKETTA